MASDSRLMQTSLDSTASHSCHAKWVLTGANPQPLYFGIRLLIRWQMFSSVTQTRGKEKAICIHIAIVAVQIQCIAPELYYLLWFFIEIWSEGQDHLYNSTEHQVVYCIYDIKQIRSGKKWKSSWPP